MPEHLRQALREGDPEALRKVMRELSEPLYRYARPQVADGQVAQDVVQQTFIRLWKHRRKLKSEGSLRTYCFFIATNLVRDTRRREALRRKRESEGAEMRQQHDRNGLAEEAFELAMNLPEELREVVLLRFAQGFTALETAEVLGIPEGTVKTRQRSALEKLRDKLGVAMAPALALPDIEGSVCEGAKTSVKVPTSLVANVEALVMASIGTQAGTAGAILVGVLLVLLLAAGVGIGIYAMPSGSSNELQPPLIGRELQQSPGDEDRTGDGELPGPDDIADDPVEVNPGEAPDPAPAASQPETVSIRITGRVVDSSGNGIAGALVRKWRQSPQEIRNEETDRLKREFERSGPGSFRDRPSHGGRRNVQPELSFDAATGGVRTNADGYYELKGRVTRDEAVHILHLDASAAGFGESMQRVEAAPLDDLTIEQNIILSTLKRYVIFSTNPKLNEEIYIHKISRGPKGGGSGSDRTQLLPDGIHQVEVGEKIEVEGKKFYLKLVVPGFLPVTVNVPESDEQRIDLGTIELSEGRTVSGIVVDADGNPVEGAIVCARNRFDALDFWAGFGDDETETYGVSKEDGSFKLSGVMDDANRVTARHPDYAEARHDLGESTSGLRLLMHAGAAVEGQVRFLAGDAPADPAGPRGVWVVLAEADLYDTAVQQDQFRYSEYPKVVPDQNLMFRFEKVPPGKYVLQAVMDAGNRFSQPVRIVVDHLPVSADLEYGAGPGIFGVVTGPNGPISGTEVSCLIWKDNPDGYTGWETCERATTDAEGRYRVDDLKAGKYVLYLGDIEPSFTILDERIVEVSTGKVELNIVLGQRPEGNRIVGKWAINGRKNLFAARLHGFGHLDGYQATAMLDDNGNFEINNIPPGRYYVYGEMDRIYVLREEVVFEGWGETVNLNRSLSMGDLKITVRDEDGATPEAKVWYFPVRDHPCGYADVARMAGGGEARKYTQSGTAVLTGLIDGRYVVYASAEGYAVQTGIVDVSGNSEVELVLSKVQGSVGIRYTPRLPENDWCHLVCIAEDVEGKPVVAYGNRRSRLDAVSQLAPGRYTLVFFGENVAEHRQTFWVKADNRVELTVPVVTDTGFVVDINAPDLNPGKVQMAGLTMHDAAGAFVYQGRELDRTDGKSLGVKALAPGTYRLTLKVDGYKTEHFEVVVTAGEIKTVKVHLQQN